MDVMDTWGKDGPESVVLGEVTSASGKPLDLRRLIQQRWGWPKKAATRAAAHLEATGLDYGDELPIRGARCTALQQSLMNDLSGLLEDLLEGIGNRSSREVHDFDRMVGCVTVAFTDGPHGTMIQDEGLTAAILGVVAQRLGVPVDEVRDRAVFDNVMGGPRALVDVGDLE